MQNPRGRFFLALLLLSTPLAASPVFITEFMASNGATLADEDGDYPDWVEIYNSGEASVNLEGWRLTDNADRRGKWVFPKVIMEPKEFLVIFASGKDRSAAESPLHTNFSLSASGEYLALVQPDGARVTAGFLGDFAQQHRDISYGAGQEVSVRKLLPSGSPARFVVPFDGDQGTAWADPGFDDSSWVSGDAGIGYETAVAGFAVRNLKANIVVDHLSRAESVIANPNLHADGVSENTAVINYFGTGSEGRYGNNNPFPGSAIGEDVDDFVIEALATVTFPSAGSWTFGVNSDDGFGLTLTGRDATTFTLSHPGPRGPADTLGVFQIPAAGEYDLRLVFYERGGGAGVELFAAQGSFSSWDSSNFRLVGDVQNGGLAVSSLLVSGGEGSLSYRSWIATDVAEMMQGENAGAYLRFSFDIEDPAHVESLTLRMKYDDGFIAYLNGVETAKRNATSPAAWDATATSSRPPHLAVQSEEINLSGYRSLLQSGRNVLAVHGLNADIADPSFLIYPELVEYRVSNLTERYFTEPTPGAPNGSGFSDFVAAPWFSERHGFSDNPFWLSLGSATEGATIRYTMNGKAPTPTSGVLYTEPFLIEETSVVRVAAFKEGYEPSSVSTRTYVFLDDVIRQSPDGSPPPGWPASWGANTVHYGMDPRVVDSPLYRDTIKDDLKTIPSISLVMDLKDLLDPAIGIYANPHQRGRDWERPTSVELIHPDGTEGFQIDAGIRIRGGFSRSTSNPKHAFRLIFRGDYGETQLEYPLFGAAGAAVFDKIDLRTFQNYSWSFQGDSRGVFLRDQFSRDTQLAMGHDAERGDFYHLYINGHYFGLFNTCERPEKAYGAIYYGGEKEDYDVIKVPGGTGYVTSATDGDMAAWTRLWELSEAGFSSDAAYQRVQGNHPDGSRNSDYEVLLDVENLIDYMLVIFYGGNIDAPISNFLGNNRPNNWYGIRNRVTGTEGFRFFIHDAEHTLVNVNENRTGPYPAGSALDSSNPQRIFQQLMANAEFRVRVADHVQRHFFNGGVLTPEASIARFLARKEQIDRAVVGESARWGASKRSVPMTRDVEWVSAINNIVENYLPRRSGIVLNQLVQAGLYPTVAAPSFNATDKQVEPGFELVLTAPGSGTLYYTRNGDDPRLAGGGISPSAIAVTGPVILDEPMTVRARMFSNGTWSAMREENFVLIQTFTDLLVTEIMYHAPAEGDLGSDEFAFIELKNASSEVMDLGGVHFSEGIRYTFPVGSSLAPGELIVLVKNPEAFASKYPGVSFGGVFEGNLSKSGETLTLLHAVGAPIFSFAYSDRSPWPSAPDGFGFSLVPVDSNYNPDPGDPSNWRASAEPGGSPGRDDPDLFHPQVWVNEVLANTQSPEVDAIELYNAGAESVDISHWYLTDRRTVPERFRIPEGTVIPPGGYLVFTEHDFGSPAGALPGFSLNSSGEAAYIYSAAASGALTGYSDGFHFDASAPGVTFGRHTISTGEVFYPPQVEATLGGPNAEPQEGPVVITEIHHHPLPGEAAFIELKNISAEAVALYDPEYPAHTWRLGGVGYPFPEGIELPAGGLLLVVEGEPEVFRIRHNIPAGVAVLGPFPGVLQPKGERLHLSRPAPPDLESNGTMTMPRILVDEVRYLSHSAWPSGTSGTNSSLERVPSSGYGNDPAFWRASPGAASPGLDNEGNRPPIVDTGGNLNLVSHRFPFAVTLDPSVTDDGLPEDPGTVGVHWTQLSGPGSVVFSNNYRHDAAAYFPGPGVYHLQLVADDGEYVSSGDLVVQIDRPSLDVILISKGSVWRYLDDGSDQGTAWRERGFNDRTWKSGPAKLGYGEGDEATVVGFGSNPADKHVTTYFRHGFDIVDASSFTGLVVRLLRDDGAVVYLNGNELLRSNMPAGDIGYGTYASSIVGGADESIYYVYEVGPEHLRTGLNMVAVEVHQVNAGSSDLSFDLELSGIGRAGHTFASWAQAWSIPANLSAPLDDADGDGLPNFLEFALGLSPAEPSSGEWILPATVMDEGRAHAGLIFKRAVDVVGIQFELEVSENLKTWVSVPSILEVIESVDAATERVRVRDLLPLEERGEKGFWRLKIDPFP